MRGIIGTIALVVAIAGCSSSGGDKADNGNDNKGTPAQQSLECAWPMFGQAATRTFAYPENCATDISTKSVARLTQKWFFSTPDVVTATPAIADDTAYVGDWSGNFYAISLADGVQQWKFTAPKHEQVYAGQIVASAAVADVSNGEGGDDRLVFVASGKTLYALDTTTGEKRWEHELNPEGADDDPTEIESSPVVANGMVIVGYDGHDQPGVSAGIVAVDAATGKQKWNFDPDQGGAPSGCGGVWSSPAVDTTAALVFAGSANCVTSPEGWNEYSEAIFALDLNTGEPKWHYQPRGPSNLDYDFAGAPNVFDVGEQGNKQLVGLGGKDGVYYAIDRTNGKLVWKRAAAVPEKPTRNFSTGGFIGASAVSDGIVVGGTAVGSKCPCLHGIDSGDGSIAWQQNEAAPTFAASAVINGVAFTGSTTDFTLRAVDVKTGEVLWSQQMAGGVAGGSATNGTTVVAVAGIREPGVDPAGTDSGVYGFELGDATTTTTAAASSDLTLPPTSVAPPDTQPDTDANTNNTEPRCLASPCDLSFTQIKVPPPGTAPVMTVHLQPSPFRVDVRAADLGDPEAWIRPGSTAAKKGAVTYGVFVSDDSLNGSLLCVLDANFDCVNETLPTDLRPSYNRISVLAIANTPVLPSAAEGFDRLVTTVSLDEPITLK